VQAQIYGAGGRIDLALRELQTAVAIRGGECSPETALQIARAQQLLQMQYAMRMQQQAYGPMSPGYRIGHFIGRLLGGL
jgi:hypothetical protein